MKKSPFKIYIDRLKDDDAEEIFEEVDPSFLDISQEDCTFVDKVIISGQAYLAKNHLILDLKIKARVQMPCSICNEKFIVPIDVEPFTQTIELIEIKSAIYDFTDEIRNCILLKVPQFVECNQGNCPQRKTVNKFLKNPSDNTYSPFQISILNFPIDKKI